MGFTNLVKEFGAFYSSAVNMVLCYMVFSAIIPAIPMYNTRRYENKADFKDLDALRSYKKTLLQSGILTQFGLIVDFIFK